jgi:D-galactarolactone cycloisomerase
MPDKIRSVEFHELRHKLTRRYGDANGLKQDRSTLIVRVETADGVIGWGEAFGSSANRDHLRQATEVLQGADASASHPLVEKLVPISLRLAAGIEIALWDIRGKRAGMSMAAMLGGPFRAAQPAYSSHQNVSESTDVAGAALAEAEAALARGYKALKMKVGWHAPDVDLHWVGKVVDALPPGVTLAIDANRALDMPTARRFINGLKKPERISWFEEPVSRAWPQAYRELRAISPIAIAGGESMDMAMLEGVIGSRAMDIINPDFVGHGGIVRMQRLWALCTAQGVRLVPHIFDGQLIRVATLHLLASQPAWAERQSAFAAAPLECDVSPNPLRDDLLQTALAPDKDGCIPVPTGPGLGVELNEKVLKTHANKLAA